MYIPRFTITNKILKNIGIIEASKEVIDKAPLLPYYEKKFKDEAIVRTVHYGTHIEGNELNLSQAEKVIMGADVVARERDLQEVLNYRKAIEYIGDFGEKFGVENEEAKKREIDDDLIKYLHKLTLRKIMPDEKSGEYRKTQVVVKNSQTGKISFRPPVSVAVPFQIKELIAFINSLQSKDIHPVLKSGIVHYE